MESIYQWLSFDNKSSKPISTMNDRARVIVAVAINNRWRLMEKGRTNFVICCLREDAWPDPCCHAVIEVHWCCVLKKLIRPRNGDFFFLVVSHVRYEFPAHLAWTRNDSSANHQIKTTQRVVCVMSGISRSLRLQAQIRSQACRMRHEFPAHPAWTRNDAALTTK